MIPTEQTAWIVANKGPPKDALVFKKDWPVSSQLSEGEVLVKVQAAALNPIGHKFMTILPNFLAKRPLPAEFDFIEDPNDSVFLPGDEVFGFIPPSIAMATKQGALQQYARVTASHIVRKPSNISCIEAAGITITAQTAWQALHKYGKFEAGQIVFINGGSSSVGAYAIQIAKAKGAARVVATASGGNEDLVRSYGADEFIDYTKMPLHEYLLENPPSTKYHLIFDAVGLKEPDLYTYSPAYLAPGGTFVTVGSILGSPVKSLLNTVSAMLRPTCIGGTPRSYQMLWLEHDSSDLQEITALIEQGRVKPVVDSVYNYDDVLSAYDRIMSSRAKGKVVVKVDPNN